MFFLGYIVRLGERSASIVTVGVISGGIVSLVELGGILIKMYVSIVRLYGMNGVNVTLGGMGGGYIGLDVKGGSVQWDVF